MSLNSWLTSLKSSRRRHRKSTSRQARQKNHRTMFVEALETRDLLAVITVTSVADNLTPNDGVVTLREAIQAHNDGSTNGNDDFLATLNGALGDDSIVFDQTVFAAAQTITLSGTELAVGSTVASSLTITGPGPNLLTISGNNASRIFNISGSDDVTLSGLTIADGFGAQGGGIRATGTGTLNVTDSTISGNRASQGGGIHTTSRGTLNITNSTISDNTASASTALGGGIYTQTDGPLIVTDSTIIGNAVTATFNGQGGGIFIERSSGFLSTAAITNSTISSNTVNGGAFGLGGGINYSAPGTFALSNSTISDNTAIATGPFGGGGGVYEGEGALTVTSTTISGNSASAVSSSFFRTAGGIQGHVTMKNTIVALNTFGTGNASLSGPDVAGPFTSLGYNLIGKSDNSTGFTAIGDQTGTIAAPLEPLLAPLANNGGPTQTMALLPGSPAMGTGVTANTPTFDQRGVARPINSPSDIGAYQNENETPVVANLIDDVMANEDQLDSVLDLTNTFSDPDAGDNLTLTATSADGSLVTATMVGTDLVLDYQLNQSGTTTVTVRATDSGGLYVEDTLTVTVVSAEDQIVNLIDVVNTLRDDGVLSSGNANALISKLENALAKVNAGNVTPPAVNQLGAFENQVEAFRNSGKLADDEADELLALLETLLTSLL